MAYGSTPCKLNALAARTATYFLNYGESDDRVTRQATSATGSRMYAGFRYALGITAHTIDNRATNRDWKRQ